MTSRRDLTRYRTARSVPALTSGLRKHEIILHKFFNFDQLQANLPGRGQGNPEAEKNLFDSETQVWLLACFMGLLFRESQEIGTLHLF